MFASWLSQDQMSLRIGSADLFVAAVLLEKQFLQSSYEKVMHNGQKIHQAHILYIKWERNLKSENDS